MKTKLSQAICAAVVLCMAGLPHAALAADDGGWDWMIAPYGWAASIGTDLSTNLPPSQSSNDLNFKDVIDHISGVFEIHVEGQGEHFGMFGDFTYLGLSDSHSETHFRTKSSLDTTLLDLAGVWNPSGASMSGFEVFAGLRYINSDLKLKLTPADPAFPSVSVNTDESYSDFLFGARYTFDMSDRWAMTLRGDGSNGETDGTWSVSATAQYKMKHGAWLFGYRYLSVALKPDNKVVDITINGPQIGYGFKF